MSFDMSDKLRNGNSETTYIILTFEESSKKSFHQIVNQLTFQNDKITSPTSINNSDINSKNNFSDLSNIYIHLKLALMTICLFQVHG